jgi:hypothetical protein
MIGPDPVGWESNPPTAGEQFAHFTSGNLSGGISSRITDGF